LIGFGAWAAAGGESVTRRQEQQTQEPDRERVSWAHGYLPAEMLGSPAASRVNWRFMPLTCPNTGRVVVPALLARDEAEPAARVGIARALAAEMDDGGQILLLPERRGDDAPALQGAGDHAIEHRRGQLDRVARQHARVETPEPALVLGHHVIAHAEALRLPEGGIGDLVHADRARRGTIHLERVPRHLPAPVGAGHRIARALDLGERGEQLGGDGGGRVAAEERRVAAPGLGGALVSVPLTGKNSSLGLRITWYVQLTADQTITSTSANTTRRTASGPASKSRPARRRPRPSARNAGRRRADRTRRTRGFRARLRRLVCERSWPCFDSTPRGVPRNPYPGGIAGPREHIPGARRK